MGLPEGDTKEGALRALAGALAKDRVPYALIGGVAVQLYSEEPRTTADIDVALASYDDLSHESLQAAGFKHERLFDHSDNWRAPGDGPRKQRIAIQFTVDKLTPGTVERAATIRVRGMRLRVAALPDLVRLKLEAAEEPQRRGSKRLSDITDVQRLLEANPEIADDVPDAWDRIGMLFERWKWELYWRKYGLPTTAEAATAWHRAPGPKPGDLDAFLKEAPDAVKAVIACDGLPSDWR
jgi:hypothetical protein